MFTNLTPFPLGLTPRWVDRAAVQSAIYGAANLVYSTRQNGSKTLTWCRWRVEVSQFDEFLVAEISLQKFHPKFVKGDF